MTVLLLHGLGGSRDDLLPLVEGRTDVVAPDLRAHGANPSIGGPADFTLEALAAEVERDLAPGPVRLVGESLGAAVAVRIALRDPARVERLVLLRPSFTTEPLPPNLRPFPVIGELLTRYGPVRGAALFRAGGLYHSVELQSRRGARGLLAQFGAPDAVRRAIRLVELPRNRAYRDAAELAPLTMPTTIVAAPRDPVHPISVAERWQRDLPNARLETVPPRDEDWSAYRAALRDRVTTALDER